MGDIIYRRPQTKKNEMSKNPLSYLLTQYVQLSNLSYGFLSSNMNRDNENALEID